MKKIKEDYTKYNILLVSFSNKNINIFNTKIYNIEKIEEFDYIWDYAYEFFITLNNNLIESNKVQLILKGFYYKLKIFLIQMIVPKNFEKIINYFHFNLKNFTLNEYKYYLEKMNYDINLYILDNPENIVNINLKDNWLNLENNFKNTIIQNRCGLSIWDLDYNFLWLDTKSESLLEIKKKSKYKKKELDILGLNIKKIKNILLRNNNLYNIFSYNSLVKFFKINNKEFVFTKNKEIINYSIISLLNIKKYVNLNKEISDYNICFKNLKSQIYFINKNFKFEDKEDTGYNNNLKNIIKKSKKGFFLLITQLNTSDEFKNSLLKNNINKNDLDTIEEIIEQLKIK